MNIQKNQRGFGAIEAILIIVALVLIGGAVFYLYHKNQTKDEATKNPNSTQTSTPAEQAVTPSSASKAVTDFYNKYVALDPPGSPPKVEAFLKQYGTNNLLTYFKDNGNGVDPIVCAQALPKSFTITSSTVTQGRATVALAEIFDGSTVSLTATVVNKNGLKIDTIQCAVPLPKTGSDEF